MDLRLLRRALATVEALDLSTCEFDELVKLSNGLFAACGEVEIELARRLGHSNPDAAAEDFPTDPVMEAIKGLVAANGS